MSWDPVYKLVKQIPRGRVLTYGAVARALRLPGGARTAGRAMAGCPSGKAIPWHRVRQYETPRRVCPGSQKCGKKALSQALAISDSGAFPI